MTAGVWFSVVNNVECKLSTSSWNISNFCPLETNSLKQNYLAIEMSLHVNK